MFSRVRCEVGSQKLGVRFVPNEGVTKGLAQSGAHWGVRGKNANFHSREKDETSLQKQTMKFDGKEPNKKTKGGGGGERINNGKERG